MSYEEDVREQRDKALADALRATMDAAYWEDMAQTYKKERDDALSDRAHLLDHLEELHKDTKYISTSNVLRYYGR